MDDMTEQIRTLTVAHRPRRRARTGLAAAAVTAITAGALTGCGSGDDTTAADPSASSPSVASSPASVGSGASGAGSMTASGGPLTSVPVYFVGKTPAGPALFQESADVPAADPLAGAVQALEDGSPTDPDYSSSYSSGAFGTVTYDAAEGFTVELTDPDLADRGDLSKKAATVAAQQLVYTLEAVQGVKNKPVTVVADGKPTTFLGFDTSKGLKPANQLGVLGLVNILSPQEGGTLSGKATVSGLASSPEGNVPWTLEDASGTVVKKGFATAEGWMDGLYPWKTTVDVTGLAAGTYTLTASTDDPSGGTEGHGPTTDTKTVTVP
jgi:hypothetical protein